MASIYKRGGKTNRHGKYVASWFDENGKRHSRCTGTSDKDAARQIASKWETDVALRRHRTHNQYRVTAVAFLQWCVEQKRVLSNTLKTVPMLNEAKDRRRVRRALTEIEMSQLLAIPSTRRPYYLFAYYTGLRVKAVRAAVRADVNFEKALTRVKVGNAKNKNDDVYQPLHPVILDELRNLKATVRRQLWPIQFSTRFPH